MLELLGEANSSALVGLIGGIALGLAARVGQFCTLGAIEDLLYSSDNRRFRMWGFGYWSRYYWNPISIPL